MTEVDECKELAVFVYINKITILSYQYENNINDINQTTILSQY